MEIAIVQKNLKATEIKPSASFSRYLSLLETDSSRISKERKIDSCPACKSPNYRPVFDKFGFTFCECETCYSLFSSTSPGEQGLKNFYRDSESRKFWFEVIRKETSEVRSRRVFEPTLNWMSGHIEDNSQLSGLPILELMPRSWDFADYWNSHKSTHQYFLVDPLFQPNSMDRTRFESLITEKQSGFAAVCLFDALQLSDDPQELLARAWRHLSPGGVCFVTGILSTGFDVLTLGADSNLILPPERLRLFSAGGLEGLIARSASWEIVEFSTPGQLDFEFVQDAFLKGSHLNRFASYLAGTKASDPDFLAEFSEFLQKWRLSSHSRVVLRKKLV